MRFLCAALFCLPTLAFSEGFETKIVADLNGDGIEDLAELTQDGYVNGATLTLTILRVDGSKEYKLVAPGLVWVGGIGQEPELRMTEHGSLQVISMNESIGRNRWHEYLTIAYRQGAHKVAGYTYTWYDTLDPDAQGTCDLNLLNGKAELTIGEGKARIVAHDLNAMPVEDWIPGIPQICVDILN